MDRPRTHVTSLLTPRKERRSERRRRKQLATLQQRRARAAAADTRPAKEKPDEQAGMIPASGEPGPAGLRSWLRFTVPPHAATSATLAAG